MISPWEKPDCCSSLSTCDQVEVTGLGLCKCHSSGIADSFQLGWKWSNISCSIVTSSTSSFPPLSSVDQNSVNAEHPPDKWMLCMPGPTDTALSAAPWHRTMTVVVFLKTAMKSLDPVAQHSSRKGRTCVGQLFATSVQLRLHTAEMHGPAPGVYRAMLPRHREVWPITVHLATS